MRTLLDTHVVLWFAAGDRRLPAKWRRVIESSEQELYFSTVSAVEISLKVARRKLKLDIPLREFVTWLMQDVRLMPMPLTLEHAIQLAELPATNPDPFDRMLVAQAMVEDLQILTRDARMRDYPVRVIW